MHRTWFITDYKIPSSIIHITSNPPDGAYSFVNGKTKFEDFIDIDNDDDDHASIYHPEPFSSGIPHSLEHL